MHDELETITNVLNGGYYVLNGSNVKLLGGRVLICKKAWIPAIQYE
jgi:hypothetical protein